jgi:hypothetical protein
MDREEMIEWLTANSLDWSGDDDREALEGFGNDKLKLLVENAEATAQARQVANAAAVGFRTEAGDQFRLNPETGNWEHQAPGPAPAPAANVNDGKGGKPAAPARRQSAPAPAPESDPDDPPRRRANNRVASVADLARNAAPELQAELEELTQLREQEREKLISNILARVSENQRASKREWLQTLDLNNLRQAATIAPPPAEEEPAPQHGRRPLGNRAGGRRGPAPEEEGLLPPVMNFGPDSTQNPVRAAPAASSEWGDPNDYDEEAVLNQLPPAVRAELMESRRILAREKTDLIDKLVENMDEQSEARQRRWLDTQPVQALRNMLALKGDEAPAPRRGMYTAAPVPLTGNNQIGRAGAEDDLLIPPTLNFKKQA